MLAVRPGHYERSKATEGCSAAVQAAARHTEPHTTTRTIPRWSTTQGVDGEGEGAAQDPAMHQQVHLSHVDKSSQDIMNKHQVSSSSTSDLNDAMDIRSAVGEVPVTDDVCSSRKEEGKCRRFLPTAHLYAPGPPAQSWVQWFIVALSHGT